jgi:hypothetical protein
VDAAIKAIAAAAAAANHISLLFQSELIDALQRLEA